MHFTTSILFLLAALASASPKPVSTNQVGNALEARLNKCPCYPNCGCPVEAGQASTCLCDLDLNGVVAPCYPNCGCPPGLYGLCHLVVNTALDKEIFEKLVTVRCILNKNASVLFYLFIEPPLLLYYNSSSSPSHPFYGSPVSEFIKMVLPRKLINVKHFPRLRENGQQKPRNRADD
ncbi:hypothetical protein F5884DRAFT_749358 [Xylogone sp. PMI_703]|nr:hypothetical protein F5884DRAFT_749358 [Xylogone sp. PMI_703]